MTSDTLHIGIRNFRHKGLKRLFENDEAKLIRPNMLETVRAILFLLDNAESLQGLDLPGYRLHRLKGDWHDYYAMTVSGNWRIIFRFENGDARDVDLIDYH